MELNNERIDRLGVLLWHGYSSYVQEIKKSLTTTEKSEVITYDAKEMPEACGQRINILV